MASSSSIITRVFSFGSAQPLLLRCNEFTQKLAIGEHWTRLRVGMLCALANTNGMNIPASVLKVGVCAEGKSCCSENAAFMGFSSGAQGGGLATYTANSGNPYFSFSGHNGIMRLGTAYTTQQSGSFTANIPCSIDANPRRGIYMSDIIKAAPSASFNLYGYSGAVAHASLDLGMLDLYNALEQTSVVSVVRGVSIIQSPVQNSGFVYNEQTYGYLNTVNIHWNHWMWPLEIYGVAVYLIN